MPSERLEQAGLNRSWIEAEAALQLEWEIRGLVLGPRLADPAIDGARWVAWARPKGGSKAEELPPVEGSGESPHQALNNLAKRLREMRK
jgi:hypothetical protein